MSFSSLVDAGKHKEAKLLLRNFLNLSERETVWRKILEIRSSGTVVDTDSLYWDTVDTCYGSRTLNKDPTRVPGCVDTCHCHVYSLSSDDQARVSRIVTVLAYNCPDIPYIPLLYPVTSLLMLAGLSEEYVYSYISMMVAPSPDQKIKYFTQTRTGWDVFSCSLRSLALKYVKNSVTLLEKEFGEEDCEELLQQWPWWIFKYLEAPTLLRIMDCFLFEGHKVLFRVALALLKLFIKSNKDKLETVKKDGLYNAFIKHVKNPGVKTDELLKIAFKFPRFSKSDIAKLTEKLDQEAKMNRLKMRMRRNTSLEELSSGARRGKAQQFFTPQHRPGAGVYQIHHLESELMSRDELTRVWDHLPDRIISVKPTLAYASNTHGVSLTTFFNRVDKYEPTILIVKTSNREVFGAYCSTSWAERNQKDSKGLRQRYFGTGETFLFKLDKNTGFVKYDWVKKDESDDDDDVDKKKETAKELFMSADNTMISVGGGNGTGIYIDENLRYGQTEKCDTFDNSPLCSTRDFEISAVEVIGFNDISW